MKTLEQKAKSNAKSRAWAKANPDKIYFTQLKYLYGISRIDWQALYNAQDGKCKICGDGGRLHLDHCHATGKTRSLLCYRCNHGLGNFRDSPQFMTTAIRYLELWRNTHGK